MKKEAKIREKRKPNKLEAFSTIIVLLVMITFAAIFKLSVVPILVFGTAWVCFIGWRCGYTWKELEDGMVKRIGSLLSVLLILLGIGFLISTWMFSGTIPTLIFYLLKVIDARLIVVLSFVLCTIVSCAIGTSWGTAGTIGIVMIGLAQTLGVSMPIVAGAVISGAHVGQLLSPMADMTNLTAKIAETDLMSSIKRTCYYAIPSVILCIVAFTVMGFMTPVTNASVESVQAVSDSLSQTFSTNPLVILPLVLLLAMCVFKLPVLPSMLASSVLAIFLGVVFNGFSLGAGLTAMYSGFNLSAVSPVDTETIAPAVLTLVNRGGMTSMGSTIVTLFCAMAYAGVMVEIGSINVIVEAAFSKVKSAGGLAAATVVVGLVTALATVSSYLTLIMPCELLKRKYIESDYHPTNVASISQSVGAIIQPVIPWGATGIYMAGISGVEIMQFAPFAIFCWGTCIAAIVTAALKFGMKTLTDEQQTAMLAEAE